MTRRSTAHSPRLAVIQGALLVGLLLGACGGDDDASPNPGGSGGPSLAGVNAGGTSTSGSSNDGATTSSGGAGGADDMATGGSVAGSSTAGSNVGGSNLYLPCESLADCKQFGGGKVCCVAGSMHFCTKPSGCSGDTLP
jgi:hypothetical protein